jgi:hypothetical protein
VILSQKCFAIGYNVCQELNKIEEVAFVLALNLFNFLNYENAHLIDRKKRFMFIDNVLNKNVNAYEGKYNEDFQLLCDDLEKKAIKIV